MIYITHSHYLSFVTDNNATTETVYLSLNISISFSVLSHTVARLIVQTIRWTVSVVHGGCSQSGSRRWTRRDVGGRLERRR